MRNIDGLCNGLEHEHVTDIHVLRNLSVYDVVTWVRVARLRYLERVIRHAPPIVFALTQATAQVISSWSHVVLNDVAWLWEHLPQTKSLPDPRCDFLLGMT